MAYLRNLNNQNYNRTQTHYGSRRFEEELTGEKFYEKLINISKEDDVLGTMQRYFDEEVGNKLCPLGTFRNIFDRSVSYHRLNLSTDVIREFQAEDPRQIDWKAFIDKCKVEQSISIDLDELLGNFNII
jgi:hypothetical protein